MPLAAELVRAIRLLAITGKSHFRRHLSDPLHYAGWERPQPKETSRKMMERMEKAARDQGARHTVGPLGKRLVSLALTENLSALGIASIFFLEKMMQYREVAAVPEAVRFVGIIGGPLTEFLEIHRSKSERLFEDFLKTTSADELKDAFTPVDLNRQQVRVRLQQEARILFEKIKSANERQDLPRCRKLIASYLIDYADQEDNNREEVDRLVQAFEKRNPAFRQDLQDIMALRLYYAMIEGITRSDLKRAIRAIRKYAHIFQGNPEIIYYDEIDKLEKKLYAIIEEKNLWSELKKN